MRGKQPQAAWHNDGVMKLALPEDRARRALVIGVRLLGAAPPGPHRRRHLLEPDQPACLCQARRAVARRHRARAAAGARSRGAVPPTRPRARRPPRPPGAPRLRPRVRRRLGCRRAGPGSRSAAGPSPPPRAPEPPPVPRERDPEPSPPVARAAPPPEPAPAPRAERDAGDPPERARAPREPETTARAAPGPDGPAPTPQPGASGGPGLGRPRLDLPAAMLRRPPGGGTQGGRGGVEGEPVPLDTPDPRYKEYFDLIREKIRKNWGYPRDAADRGDRGPAPDRVPHRQERASSSTSSSGGPRAPVSSTSTR